MIEIAIATEDALTETLAEILLQQSGLPFRITQKFRRQGFGYLKGKISEFNQIARWHPVLVLTDLDQGECAPRLRRDWLRQPPASKLLFRVAVRETEAWLLADSEAFAAWIGVSAHSIPVAPDALSDPKQALLRLVGKSHHRALKQDILPARGARAAQGLGYNERLCCFVRECWRAEVAAQYSPSLARARRRVLELAG